MLFIAMFMSQKYGIGAKQNKREQVTTKEAKG